MTAVLTSGDGLSADSARDVRDVSQRTAPLERDGIGGMCSNGREWLNSVQPDPPVTVNDDQNP